MKVKLTILFVLLLAVTACTQRPIIIEQQSLPESGWSKECPVEFKAEISDTLANYDILLTIRNNESYPNQNLWLFVEELTPDSIVHRDTVQCFLVDNQGYWIGQGVGDLHYIEVYYTQRKRFKVCGNYFYRVYHGMRYELLEGLTDIGIKIQPNKEK